VTVVETLLVFVGIPLLIVGILAVLTLRPDKGHKRLRYKPGQPWEHAPVWYEPHPEFGPADAHGDGHGESLAIGAGHGAAATPSGTGARPHPGGPLGGARGTW
jgi:hypothetical protein